MKTIIIEVAEDGTIKIDAIGFRGSACAKATEAIERALGKTTGGGRKPEFSQVNSQGQTQGH